MPFPSLRCLTCKQRRVKCDETRPTCGQCSKGSRQCVYDDGITENGKHRFKSENAYATGHRQRRPREKKAGELSRRTGDLPNSNSSAEPSDSPAPWAFAESTSSNALVRSSQYRESRPLAGSASTLHLHLPVEAHALAHYATKYCTSPAAFPEIIDGPAQYFLPAYQTASDDSALNFTIRAASLASFGITQGHSDVLSKAERIYSKALVSTKKALMDPQQLASDELLVTVFALSQYEGMLHTADDTLPKGGSGPGFGYRQLRSWAHLAGAASLLELRKGLDLPESQLSLDRTVRRGLIKAYLLREEPIPTWIENGADFGEEGLGLAIDQATVRVSNLRQQASGVLKPTLVLRPFQTAVLRTLIDEAHAIDATLTELFCNLPEEWNYTVVNTIPSEDMYYGSKAYVYKSLGHAALWNRYRGLRLLVHDTLLRAYEHLRAAGEQLAPMLTEASHAKIQMLLKDICASVPQYFGHIATSDMEMGGFAVQDNRPDSDGQGNALSINLLSFSLLVALSMSCLSDGQRTWLKARLTEVAKRANRSVLHTIAGRR